MRCTSSGPKRPARPRIGRVITPAWTAGPPSSESRMCAFSSAISSSPGSESDLVRHRRGRDEDRLLLAEQIGHPALELVDGRVLAPLLVSDERVRDRLAHAGARLCLGVRAKVDHASTLASVRY